MTKNIEREAARQLRLEQGMSVKEIAKTLGVSKSSVSLWVRDIELTPAQIQALQDRMKSYGAQHKGSQANITKHRAIRQQYQEEGREKAHEHDLLHLQGCMLYWGEGGKGRIAVKFANSDPDMMQVFIKFVRESLQVPEAKIKIRIYCYLNNGLSLEEIHDFWLKTLKISVSQLGKGQVNNQPSSSQQKGRKLLYGVCHLTVDSSRYIQRIYGAIQEYTGINKPEWLG